MTYTDQSTWPPRNKGEDLAAENERLREDNVRLTLRLAEACEEDERLREALRVAFAAADDLLAPICAEAGRVLLEMPDENMTEHLPVLPAKLFAALYDATHPDILATLSEQEGN